MHAITRLIGGGAEENTILTCNHQAASGNDVFLVIGKSFDQTTLGTLNPAVKIIIVRSLIRNVSPIHDLVALVSLAATLRRLDPDVVHTHTSKAGILARLAALATRRCTVIHTVHILPFLSVGALQARIYVMLERLVARWTRLFIDVSDGMMRESINHGVGTASNHVVIESGMDLSRFQEAVPLANWQSVTPGAHTDSTRGPDGTKPLFVLITGALEARKRVGDFLPVFARVVQAVSNARLLIVGDGPLRPDVEAAIAANGLENNVSCLGFRDDLPALIALADVCVHAAHREGLPRVVVQYAIVGRPIVAAELPGLERIVQEGQTGFLVPSNDLGAMAEPLISLLQDAEKRQRFGDLSRAQDFGPWDATAMVTAIDRAYETVLAPGCSPAD